MQNTWKTKDELDEQYYVMDRINLEDAIRAANDREVGERLSMM